MLTVDIESSEWKTNLKEAFSEVLFREQGYVYKIVVPDNDRAAARDWCRENLSRTVYRRHRGSCSFYFNCKENAGFFRLRWTS